MPIDRDIPKAHQGDMAIAVVDIDGIPFQIPGFADNPPGRNPNHPVSMPDKSYVMSELNVLLDISGISGEAFGRISELVDEIATLEDRPLRKFDRSAFIRALDK